MNFNMGIVTNLKPVDWACALGGTAAGKAIAGNSELSAAYTFMASGAYLGLVASRKFFQTGGSARLRQFLLTTSCWSISYLATDRSFSLLSRFPAPVAYAGGLTALLASLLLTKCICKKSLTAMYQEEAGNQLPALVKRWFVNNREIQVLNVGGVLEFEIIENGLSRRRPLVTDGRDLETQIEYLADCEAVEKENGSYLFKKPVFFSRRFTHALDVSEGEEVLFKMDNHIGYALFKRERDFAYQIYYQDERFRERRVAVQVPTSRVFVNDALGQDGFSGYGNLSKALTEAHTYELVLNGRLRGNKYLKYLQYLKVRSIATSEELEKNSLTIKKYARYVAIKRRDSNPIFVIVAPEFVRSRLYEPTPFNSSRYIFNDYWAVTLICASGCSDNSDDYFGNHAELIIEGLSEGEYFMTMAHLAYHKKKKTHVVETKNFTQKAITYSGKTHTWKTSVTLVKKMLNKIEEDKSRPPNLNPLGSDSIFSKEGDESCLTWARKKLEIINIHLGRSKIGWIVSPTGNFMNH